MADANIRAVITADDKASKTLSDFGDHANRVGKSVLIGFAALTAGAIAFGVSSVKAFSESEDVMKQTEATLKSTGGVAGVTSDQVTKLASSLQKVTKFSDETIQSGENLLLTFTNIGKDIFPQATETMLNMSQALGQDVKSSAIQLGKALQDPILGVTALRRVGVNFSSKQQDVIKALVETGKSAEAQKLILKELNTEFGNSAVMAGQTFSGKIEILKNQFDDIKESIGKTIVDGLTPFMTQLSNFVASDQFQAWLTQLTAWISVNLPIALNYVTQTLIPNLKNILEATWPVVRTVLVAFSDLITFLADHTWIVLGLATAFVAVKTAMFLVGALQAFQAVMAGVRSAYLITAGVLSTPIAMPAILIAAALASLYAVYQAVQNVKSAIEAVNGALQAGVAAGNSMDEAIRKINASNLTPAQKAKAIQSMSVIPKRAVGGPVGRDAPYMVGEQGPELFVPQTSGTIIPNGQSGGAGPSINININAQAFMGSQQDARKFAEMIMNAWGDLQGARGMA